MPYCLVLDPALGVAPADLVAAWNADPQRATTCRAETSAAPAQSFVPGVAELILITGTTVGFGLVTNALYDILQDLLNEPNPQEIIETITVDQPDGTTITIVRRRTDLSQRSRT